MKKMIFLIVVPVFFLSGPCWPETYTITDAFWQGTPVDEDCDGYYWFNNSELGVNVHISGPGSFSVNLVVKFYQTDGVLVGTATQSGILNELYAPDVVFYFLMRSLPFSFPHNQYVAYIELYKVGDPFVKASRSPGADPDLQAHNFELREEDYDLSYPHIDAITWSHEVDPDHDGYVMSKRMNVTVSALGDLPCPPYTIRLFGLYEYEKGKINSNVTLGTATPDSRTVNWSFVIGARPPDFVQYDFLEYGKYKFDLELIMFPTYDHTWWNWNGHADVMSNHRFETEAQNKAIIACNQMNWATPPECVDQDGDGYRSQDKLYLETQSWSYCYYKVYYKPASQTVYTLYATTASHALDPSYQFVAPVGVPPLANGLYDFKLELFNHYTNYLVATYDEKSNTELNDQKFELPEQDGSVSSQNGLTVHAAGSGAGQIRVDNVTCNLPFSRTAAAGTRFSLEALPDPCSHFDSWTGAPVSSQAIVNYTLSGNDTLYVIFNLNEPCANMLKNGDFSLGYSDWTFYAQGSAKASGYVRNGEFVVTYTNPGDADWNVVLEQPHLRIENGGTYCVYYEAHASATRQLMPFIGSRSSPWPSYCGYQADTLSVEKQEYTYWFTMRNPTDNDARLVFNAGLSLYTLFLDNVRVVKGTRTNTSPLVTTFKVTVPDNTPTLDAIYLAGDFNFWDPGPGQPGIDGLQHDLAMCRTGTNQWEISLPNLSNSAIQYKYTRGTWLVVEANAAGVSISNRSASIPSTGDFLLDDAVANWIDTPSAVEGFPSHGTAAPVAVQLHQNFPNPFNQRTEIVYELPCASRVRLSVFDLHGHAIKELHAGDAAAGSHRLYFDAAQLPSGIYFYRLAAAAPDGRVQQVTRKLMLVK